MDTIRTKTNHNNNNSESGTNKINVKTAPHNTWRKFAIIKNNLSINTKKNTNTQQLIKCISHT